MYNVLILAANGMAGHVISQCLEQNNNLNVLKTTRDNSCNNQQNIINIDLKNTNELKQIIADFKPRYVINCAGILVKASKDNPSEAILINSYLPNLLDDLSKQHNFKLIHISTDCVFSGKKGNYTEQDTPDAYDCYGRSKALGEINNDHNLTIRTSIIGPELKYNGTGLLNWFLNQSGSINGFTSAVWSGVTTLELAKFINIIIQYEIDHDLITNNLVCPSLISGIYHLTNNTVINKYELLSLFKKTFNTDHITISPVDACSVDKSFINNRAELNKDVDYQAATYDQMLKELYQYMTNNRALYKHYKVFA